MGNVRFMKSWLVCLIAITSVISLPVSPCAAAEKAPGVSAQNPDSTASRSEVEVSSFETRDDAERLAVKMRGSGFEATVHPYTTKGGRTVYGVFVVVRGELPPGAPARASGAEEERPVGTSRVPRNIFSRTARFFHAALSVQGVYTDNAFNSSTDKKSDFSAIYSPEVWVSAPRLNERPEGNGSISPRSPGGLQLGPERFGLSRKYRAFLHYLADIPQHSANSPSGNTVAHTAEGGFAYNLSSGISLDLRETFLRSYETVDTSALAGPGAVDRYKSNLLYLMTSYDTGNRFVVRFDYSNFLLRYDAGRNSPRNRTDNSFSGYLYYKLKAKTSVFVQYSHVDVGYEQDHALDSTEHNFYGGFQWDITAKSRGSVKAGYGTKDFSGDGTRNDSLIFEAKVDHRFTPKTSLSLAAFRKTDETNIPSTFFVLTQGVSANYQQLLTSRITGSAVLSYTNEKYGGDLTFGGVTARRADDVYRATLGFQYEFRRWLKAGIIYTFTRDDSNFPEFNYSSNTVNIRVTGSL
jgi:hypothetical protein